MRKNITFTILLSIIFVSSWAQNDTILKNEQIDIIKAYEPVLIRANKVMINPKLPELKTNISRDLQYDIAVKLIEVDYQPTEIKPLPIKTEPKVELPIMRLKAGFGNYMTPLLDLDITNKNTDKFRVGLNVNHLSSKRNKRENQRFNETGFKAFGEYNISEDMKVGLGATYMLDNYFFYGYNQEDTSFAKDESKIGYNTGGFNLYFSGAENSLDLKYNFNLDFLHTGDSYENKSDLINLALDAEKSFNNSFVVGTRLGINFNTYKQLLEEDLSRVLFNFNPYMGYNHKRFSVHAGLTLLTDAGDFGVLPDIKLKTVLVPGMLSMYNHWTGDLNFNNLYSLSTENPWLQQGQTFNNGTTEIRTFLGLTGNIAKRVDYDVRISQLVYRDKLLFLNDTTDERKFMAVYDSKLTAWNPHMMVGYNHSDFLFLKLAFDYYKYNPAEQTNAWHLPQMVTTFSGVYHFNHKLVLKTDLFVEAGRKSQLADQSVITLKPIADLNFGVNYYFNKNIGLFANANNVLSLKRERYRNYDLFGFQVLGGIIASF
jgi:hypothetical protein